MSSRRQYLLNMIWSWLGAALLITNGIVVSPFFIRRLGTDRYGIWALGLSLVEYFWLIDLGLRPATVKLSAEYRALEDWKSLNGMLSTAVSYSAVMGLLILALVSLNTGWIAAFFRIQDPSFPLLLQVVSVSWAFGLVCNVFAAATEGFQRFDITNRIFIVFLAFRSFTLLALVWLGYGLAAMSVGLLVTQLSMYATFFVCFWRLYPQMRVSPALVSKTSGLHIWRTARQMISGMLSARVLQSAIPSLIARQLSVRHVTYYSVAQKMMDYASEGIGRVGMITSPRAAELMVRGQKDEVVFLAQYGNRYCLVFWLACGTYFLAYGEPLCKVWINGEIAAQAAILLPIMVVGYTLWLGQFISASILMGIGRYGVYSASLMVEAVLVVIGFWLAMPHFGLAGGVVVASALMALNRCVNLSLIFCREFNLNPINFLWHIYCGPIALGAVQTAFLLMLRNTWIAGRNWRELITASLIHGVVYACAAFWLLVHPDHRAMVLDKLTHHWRSVTNRRAGVVAAAEPGE